MTGATAVTANTVGAGARERRSSGGSIFSQRNARLGYLLAAAAAVAGWFLRDINPIDPGRGLGYALGIGGGSLMTMPLLYSARKRFRWLRYFGATKHWFRLHMILGIVGPLMILYHCNFDVGSLNSKTALYCTLIVASSGIIGRYLYARIHRGLYGRKTSLAQLTTQLQHSNEQLATGPGLMRGVRERLIDLGNEAVQPPRTLGQILIGPMILGLRTRWLYLRLSWMARKDIMTRALTSPAVAAHQDRLLTTTRRFLRDHLARTRQVAQFGFYERLFSLWHIVHVPLLMMMVLSAIVHIFAVHMY